MDLLQEFKENKVMELGWLCFYTICSAEYPRTESFAVYLTGPNRCWLLWAVETEWNNQWGTLSNPIEAPEPSTARKAATMRAEAR